MAHTLPVLITLGLTAIAAAGCDRARRDDVSSPPGAATRTLDNSTFNAGLNPSDPRIVAFVDWLKAQGVTLECRAQTKDLEALQSGDYKAQTILWFVSDPKISDDYEVHFSIRSFPTWATESQMHDFLDVNLAYMLNASEFLAMSYAVVSGKRSESALPATDEDLPKLNGLPITTAIEKLFREYRPGPSGKRN